MKRITLLLFTTAIVLFLCRALPGAESGGDSGVVTSNNPFDAEPVTACRRPSTNVCSINYEVPASIAALADIIEYEIQGKLTNPLITRRQSCVAGIREALCAFRFPRCDGSNVVMNSTPNCTQKILTCDSRVRQLVQAEGLCQLQATVQLDSCAPLSESQIQFRRCSVVDASTSVTAWMLKYINLTDREWDLKLNTSLTSFGDRVKCIDNLLRYHCEFYGQCTGNGQIEIRNSEGFCNDMISCYPDETASAAKDIINCELWPLDRPSSPHTTTQLLATTTTQSGGNPSIIWPGPPTLIGNGVALHQLTTTLLISFFLAIFLS